MQKGQMCLYQRENNKIAICGTIVDDRLFIGTQDDAWMKVQIAMLQNKYEEVTVEEGEELGLVGMHVNLNRKERKVIFTQPMHVGCIIEAFNVSKGAPNLALAKLMDDDSELPMLKDRMEFMSKYAMLMYAS
jgi:hypothetical protein